MLKKIRQMTAIPEPHPLRPAASPLFKLLRILLIPALLACLLLGFSRDLRTSWFGVLLHYLPVAQSKDKLILLLRISEGQEIQGKQSAGPVIPSETSSLQAELEETTQAVSGSELEFNYRLTEMRSEQFAWRQDKSSKILDARWEARVAPEGPLLECKATEKARSPWLEGQNLEGWLSALWLGLPRGRVRPLDNWSAEVQVPLKVREFHEPLLLQHRFTYHLARVFQEGRQRLAQVEWAGTVSAAAPVEASGQLSGSALIDLDRGICIDADFVVDQEVHAPIEGLPGNDDEGIVFGWHQKQHGKVFRPG